MTDESFTTPIRTQYLEIKRQHPNAIVFFRLGDFYETFDQDAEITSRELDIVLTSRGVSKGKRIPMAGIPYHAVENYLGRLIEKGYHIAICEQVGDQPIKGLFPRQVVRIVTPGTVVEAGLLRNETNNYLVAISLQEKSSGLAYADISTGEFAAIEFASDASSDHQDPGPSLRAEINRLNPAEILYPENTTLPEETKASLTALPSWRFDPARGNQELKDHFGVEAMDGFGLRGLPQATAAAGVIIQYLRQNQPAALSLLSSLHTYTTHEFMALDATTLRNLELTETIREGKEHGSLLSILDQCVTAMGHRLMRRWVSTPLLETEPIERRLNGVECLVQQGMGRTELRATLHHLSDLERLTNRVVAGTAQPRDLVAIRTSLGVIPSIREALASLGTNLEYLQAKIHPCSDELDLITSAIEDDPPATLQASGVIRPGYSSELESVIEASRHAREWIANLETVERERTGIRSLKVGYNKVFGYYIEITHAKTESVPPEYIRKQTLVNAERYITPEMKEYETLVMNAEERIREIEQRLFKEVCLKISAASTRILTSAKSIAEVDVLSSLAEVAVNNRYTRPKLSREGELEICDGRHPVVELSLAETRFVPNDTNFEDGEIVRVITGPNMSGKSTFLRQTALIVLMAQMGSFVPASSAHIGIVDRIFTRIGAQDELHAGQSTFMVEMIEAANILHHASNRSLLILDEIGRGTSTYDGVSIAWAVIEYIHNHPRLRARTLFATHYHELTQLASLLPGVRNYNVAVSEAEGQVVFLHKIVPGGADRSYGIHVAQLAGLPRPVVQRAGEIMKQLESSSGQAVKINPQAAQQLALFPETNPLVNELKGLDINSLSPIEALNKLYEWQNKFASEVK